MSSGRAGHGVEHVDDAGANRLEAAATIRTCPTVATGWKGEDRQRLEDAPTFECGDGPTGSARRLEDASWEIDLSGIPRRDGHREFALVPVEGTGAAADFQLVFERTLKRR